jgi:hypothetical protein
MTNICSSCVTPQMDEAAMMDAVTAESVRRVAAQFGADSPEARSTQNRRQSFRTTPLLSDDPFEFA